MLDVRLYFIQRLTAMLMVPMVFGHLAVLIYTAQVGMSADSILSRTQGSVPWLLFYGAFVLVVSMHAAIGLRVIVFESFDLTGLGLSLFTWTVFFILCIPGATAVYAVTLA